MRIARKGYESKPLIDRFWAKVKKRDDGCWEWTAALGPGGYGSLMVGYKSVRAHRVAYELFVGPIPSGLLVMHSCDRPWCVNPDHLSVGTHADNMRDCTNKGRRALIASNRLAALESENTKNLSGRH